MTGRICCLPDMEPTAEPTWLASNFISGPTQLPVRFTPAATTGAA